MGRRSVRLTKAAEAEEAIADLVDAMEAFGGEPPEVLEEVFKPEVRGRWLTMVLLVVIYVCV